MANERQIELVGGPFDGEIHELHGTLKPAQIALPDEDGLHWYAVRDGKGRFVRTEPKKPSESSIG